MPPPAPVRIPVLLEALLFILAAVQFSIIADESLFAAMMGGQLRRPLLQLAQPVRGPSPEVPAYIRQQLKLSPSAGASFGGLTKGKPPGGPGCCTEWSCFTLVESACLPAPKDCDGKFTYRLYECVPGASSYTCSSKIVSESTVGCFEFVPCEDCGEYVCSMGGVEDEGGACTAANSCKNTYTTLKCGDPKKNECLRSGSIEFGCQNPPGSPECAQKCVSGCGDGVCKKPPESCGTCPKDCGACPLSPCGDGICRNKPPGVETCLSCPKDCGACPPSCGDGVCKKTNPGKESCVSCPKDCGVCPPPCGDGVCNINENCSLCSKDCGVCPACGDGVCNWNAPWNECSSCEKDCAGNSACPPPLKCPDGICNGAETCTSCPSDCGACNVTCGNKKCDLNLNECKTCPSDCTGNQCPKPPQCGDGSCQLPETCTTCQPDCGKCPPPPPPICTGPAVRGCPLKTDSCKYNKCYRKNKYGVEMVVPNTRCGCK